MCLDLIKRFIHQERELIKNCDVLSTANKNYVAYQLEVDKVPNLILRWGKTKKR